MVSRTLFALWSVASLGAGESAGYRNTVPGVAYIGSRACAGCHAKLYRDYIRTAMGRSMGRASSAAQLEKVPAFTSIHSDNLNRHFEVFQQGTERYQAEFELDAGGREIFRTKYKLEYAIAAGTNGYTYIVRRGNYLFQAPLSYYSRKQAWDLSPGYEFADYGFQRPIAAACIGCHSWRPQPVRDRAGLFDDPLLASWPSAVKTAMGRARCMRRHGRRAPQHRMVRISPSSIRPGYRCASRKTSA